MRLEGSPYGLTWTQAWALFFANHPEVVATWGYSNGRWPNCTCRQCDPDGLLPRPDILADGE